jgi:hypothetical protein
MPIKEASAIGEKENLSALKNKAEQKQSLKLKLLLFCC